MVIELFREYTLIEIRIIFEAAKAVYKYAALGVVGARALKWVDKVACDINEEQNNPDDARYPVNILVQIQLL